MEVAEEEKEETINDRQGRGERRSRTAAEQGHRTTFFPLSLDKIYTKASRWGRSLRTCAGFFFKINLGSVIQSPLQIDQHFSLFFSGAAALLGTSESCPGQHAFFQSTSIFVVDDEAHQPPHQRASKFFADCTKTNDDEDHADHHQDAIEAAAAPLSLQPLCSRRLLFFFDDD